MYTHDSFGNELPRYIILDSGASKKQIADMLLIKGFLSFVQTSLSKGKTVQYDKESKQAYITDSNGMTAIVSHL